MSGAFGAVKGTCWGAGFVRGDVYAGQMWCVLGFWHADGCEGLTSDEIQRSLKSRRLRSCLTLSRKVLSVVELLLHLTKGDYVFKVICAQLGEWWANLERLSRYSLDMAA